MTMKRTVLRSRKGKKLFAVRKKGKFADIQSYKKCSRQDQQRKSKAEKAAAAKRHRGRGMASGF